MIFLDCTCDNNKCTELFKDDLKTGDCSPADWSKKKFRATDLKCYPRMKDCDVQAVTDVCTKCCGTMSFFAAKKTCEEPKTCNSPKYRTD